MTVHFRLLALALGTLCTTPGLAPSLPVFRARLETYQRLDTSIVRSFVLHTGRHFSVSHHRRLHAVSIKRTSPSTHPFTLLRHSHCMAESLTANRGQAPRPSATASACPMRGSEPASRQRISWTSTVTPRMVEATHGDKGGQSDCLTISDLGNFSSSQKQEESVKVV